MITGLGFVFSIRCHNPQTKQSFLYSEFVKALQLQEYWSNCSASNFWITYVCDLNMLRTKNAWSFAVLQTTVRSKSNLDIALAKKKEEHSSSKICQFNHCNINFLPPFFTLHWTIQANEMYKTALFPSRLTWWKLQQKNEGFCFLSHYHSKTTVSLKQQKVYVAIVEITTKDSSQKNN